MIKISVIIPVYNAQDYLKECVESLVSQTLDEIELIFVNDGSKDDSLNILENYRKQYPQKIRIITQENKGQASARNLGITHANGEYIGFVDADDYVSTDMYEKMYSLAVKKNCDFVECRYQYLKIEENGCVKRLPCYGNVRPHDKVEDMFIDPLVSPWNKIYRAKIIKENYITFPEGVVYEDTAFYLKAIPFLKKIDYEPGEYVYHFLRSGSTMNSKNNKRVENIFPVLSNAIEFYKKNHFWDKYNKELEYFCVKILLCSSLKRIAKVSDQNLKKQYKTTTLDFIQRNFPYYKKNVYIRKSKNRYYLMLVNEFTLPLVLTVLKYSREG